MANENLQNPVGTGFVPKTHDYAGVITAIKNALASPLNKTVVFEDCTYDLGANYIPIVSGIEYVGAPLRYSYVNGGWTDRGQTPIGGSIFITTNAYTFWDGATQQAAVTATIANQICTTSAGSSLISVPNSALFTVGQRVYTPASSNGFYAGVAYFVLTASANVVTLGLADFVPVTAISSGSLTLSAGYPNDSTSGTKMHNLIGLGANTFIKAGAKNTFSFVFSELDGIYATGNHANINTYNSKRLIDIVNFAQSNFSNIITNDGDGQYYGADYPFATFLPGNSKFRHIFNAGNSIANEPLFHHGILFQAEAGANLNEIHADDIQDNRGVVTLQTDATASTTAASTSIAVADSTKWPIGMPLWFSSVGTNASVIYAGPTYFVLSQVDATHITISLSKGGSVLTPPATSAVTINSYGFPSLELCGVGSGATLTGCTFTGLDIEGTCTTLLLLQQIGYSSIQTNQSDSTLTNYAVTGRGSAKVILTSNMGGTKSMTTDFDSTCNIEVLGFRGSNAPQSGAGGGLWYNDTAGMWALSLHTTKFSGLTTGGVALQGVSPSTPWVKAFYPVCNAQQTKDTTGALAGSTLPGTTVFNGSAGQTFTLPTITDASPSTTMVGYAIMVINSSANSLSLSTDGTQTINNVAAKTTTTIATGQLCMITACKTGGGTLFWAVQTMAAAV